MKLELKTLGVGVYQENLDSFWPEDEFCFGEWVTIAVGVEGREGADNFNLFVCSPNWLKEENKNYAKDVWGLHKLIIPKYNSEHILKLVNEKLNELSNDFTGKSEKDLLSKVGRYAHWEFEGYVPYEQAIGSDSIEKVEEPKGTKRVRLD